MKKILIICVVLCLMIVGCKSKKTEPQAGDDTTNISLGEIVDSSKTIIVPVDSVSIALARDSALTLLTKEVFTAFKNQQYAKLDSFIHPTEGVRFSPYATVDAGDDKKFSREAFMKQVTTGKNKKISWGKYDGSGDAILLTPGEYFKKFVYDANYVHPEKYKINQFAKTGNSINNLKSIYDGAQFTESHFSGTKKNGGLDWKSVRLVFKEMNGKYYLVGVVHDQWTI